MAQPPKKAYVQFSKRVTVAVTVMWCAFRLITLALIAFRPETAEAMTAFQQGVDDVMIVSIGFYCGNSVAEKGILGYFSSKRRTKTDEENNDEDDPFLG